MIHINLLPIFQNLTPFAMHTPPDPEQKELSLANFGEFSGQLAHS